MNRAVPGTSSLANETMAMGQGNMQQVSDRTFAHETCFAKPYSHTTRPIRQPSAISNKSNDLLPYLPMNEGEFDASESMPTALQDKQSVQVHLTQSSSMTLDLPRCAWHASLPIPESVDNSNVLSAEEPQIPTLDERQPWNQDPIIFFHKPAIRQSRGDESIPSTMARHVETVVAPFRLNKAFDYNTGRKNLQEVSSIKEFSLCTKRSPIKVKHQCKILWHDRNEAKRLVTVSQPLRIKIDILQCTKFVPGHHAEQAPGDYPTLTCSLCDKLDNIQWP